MPPKLGRLVLGLSGAGFPLTQLAIRQLGRRGAIVTEGVCVGLAVRDAAMIAAGTPSRLRRGPAALLWLEFIAALAAAALGLRLATGRAAVAQANGPRPDRSETARRAAVGTLFGLHTVRFRIYLQPDRGVKSARPK
ncbi:MAG: hypothetical protein ACLQBX_10325 [Candidatus Limnocylindrales bacterium]